MNIWIRTQDKMELAEVHYIKVAEIGEDFKIYGERTTSGYIGLGIYGTKERAIEVLDEIQYSMKNFAFAKKLNGLGEELDLIPNPILIYQMPEN